MDHSIVFSHVNKAYGKTVVVEDLNLEIRRGERLILLGPSGCGKTTTLRMIAGFEEITGGELYMDGKVVNDIPPGERNIAMVFQSYALFPHLSVWDNITFGLVLQKLPKEEIFKDINSALSNNEMIIIFPEGTRGEDNKLKEFKTGVSHIAEMNPNVPIIPLFINGPDKILPKVDAILVPFISDIYISNPIFWDNSSKKEFTEKIKQVIENLYEKHINKNY